MKFCSARGSLKSVAKGIANLGFFSVRGEREPQNYPIESEMPGLMRGAFFLLRGVEAGEFPDRHELFT
jgi:hypothetical protein